MIGRVTMWYTKACFLSHSNIIFALFPAMEWNRKTWLQVDGLVSHVCLYLYLYVWVCECAYTCTSAFQSEAGNWQGLKAVSKNVGDEWWWIPTLEDALWSCSKPAVPEQHSYVWPPARRIRVQTSSSKTKQKRWTRNKRKGPCSRRKPMSIKHIFWTSSLVFRLKKSDTRKEMQKSSWFETLKAFNPFFSMPWSKGWDEGDIASGKSVWNHQNVRVKYYRRTALYSHSASKLHIRSDAIIVAPLPITTLLPLHHHHP